MLKMKIEQLFSIFLIIFLSVIGWYIYNQANGLTWQFDDFANLKGLDSVDTYQGMINFIFGGAAGPSGRPISLLSFIPNASDWPNNPWSFVESSLLWHLMNSLLVYLIAIKIFNTQNKYQKIAWWMALITAFIWAFSPIQTSTILMPVQRMTLVSAFFSLLTIYVYIKIRTEMSAGGVAYLLLISVVVSVGVLLSVYSKENGVLTITFIGLIEVFFLRNKNEPKNKKLWNVWKYLALLIVPVFLISYICVSWDEIQHNYTYYRNFSLSERLSTELVILIEYLKQIIIPRSFYMGPFHDGHDVYNFSLGIVWFAISFWLIVLCGCFYLYRHKKTPIVIFFIFFIIFYLVAHLIESSFIPLELYFEHRNYIAVLGWALLFPVILAEIKESKVSNKILVLLSGSYGCFLLYSTLQITSLWGNQLLSAEMWAKSQPNSTRAIQTLASQYDLVGFQEASVKILDEFYQAHPEHVSVGMQVLVKKCSLQDYDSVHYFNNVQSNLKLIKQPLELTTMLATFGRQIRNNQCNSISIGQYVNFLQQAMKLDVVNFNTIIRHHIYYELALTYEKLGNNDLYLDYAKKAFFDYPSLSIAQVIAVKLFALQQNEEAVIWIDQALSKAPKNASDQSWQISLLSLKDSIQHTNQSLISKK